MKFYAYVSLSHWGMFPFEFDFLTQPGEITMKSIKGIGLSDKTFDETGVITDDDPKKEKFQPPFGMEHLFDEDGNAL